MKTDFNRIIDRKDTFSLKYDFAVERGLPEDVLPLWVADMDFKCPDCVTDALGKMTEKGIFGYSEAKTDYYDTVRKWFLDRFGWESDNSWIVKTPGVVYALAAAVQAFSNKGDKVLIQTPVYYPFYEVIRDNDRVVAENPLKFDGHRYTMDLEDLERQLKDEHIKLMILCSPHNPICRVWSLEELQELGRILKKYDVTLISDEIHCDIVYKPAKHYIFAQAVPEMAGRTIICTSPSKAFNLAGLQVSNIFIQDEELRKRFKKVISRTGYSQLSLPGLVACRAAYEGGKEWLDELLIYLKGNLDYIRDFLREELPSVKLIEPEGTYFAWLDLNGLGLSDIEIEQKVRNEAKLWLDGGRIFGRAGKGFQRVVYACPRDILKEALNRLKVFSLE